MLIRYPEKIKANSVIDELALNIDLAPTILELAGVTIPDYVQGESMVPLFENSGDHQWRSSFMFEYYVDDAYPYAGPDMLSIRTKQFKLVDAFLKKDIDELYDLDNDPRIIKN
jgi:N-acetylglucosamine-6-sulfatase